MFDDSVKMEIQEHIAILYLNRPAVHNSVNEAMMAALENSLDQIETNDRIKSIILTGTGKKTFCAGGDLSYFATLKNRELCKEMSRRMQMILERLYSGKRTVIAAINGQALGGGCEILTACHFRIAASHAVFAFRQSPNGIITGWGGGWRLLKLLQKPKALWLLLTGESLVAAQALQFGFIDQIVEANKLLETAIALAKKINQNSSAAVAAFLRLAYLSDTADQENIKAFESEQFADLWIKKDFRSFLASYLKKHPEALNKKPDD